MNTIPYKYLKSHPTEHRIENFRMKQYGWHYSEGVAFKPTILDRAINLHRRLICKDSFQTNAFPGLNGEILITAYCGNRYWEFYTEPDDTFTFVYEIDDQEITRQKKLTLDEIQMIIAKL